MGRELGRRHRRGAVIVTAALALGAVLSWVSAPGATAKAAAPRVLYVYPSGTPFAGVTPPADLTFTTVQAAVSAAHKGDWILVAPGDYHESDDVSNPPSASDLSSGWYGGVDVETPDVHIRGMNRNSVIIDGTLSSAATPCSPLQSDQNTLGGKGRNGILVWKASGVTVDNLTVCNFLAGTGNAGNEIWWNGGAGSGKVGLKGYSGSYLTATSTYFAADNALSSANVCSVCSLYGIFASNSKGPGTLSNLYANNFSDSGMYIGACMRVCNVTVSNVWMEDNALGYSGTNSGGQIQVENSTFDNNKDGFDTNTALTGDPPPPQDGRCTGKGTKSAITGTGSCWVFTGNLVENNNNPNVPIAGTAGLGPTGTGMTISGGRNDTIMGNEFLDNGAWGVLFVPYPDANLSSDGKTCKGTKGLDVSGIGIPGLSCAYDPMGDVLSNNKFSGNGTLGNPSNADFGNLLIGGNEPTDCFSGNTEWNATFSSQTGSASNANVNDGFSGQTPATCGTKTPKQGIFGPTNTDGTLLTQVECDAGVLSGSSCSSAHYPQATAVVMQPLPGAVSVVDPSSSTLPSMPNPCVGVPSNSWCPGGVPA